MCGDNENGVFDVVGDFAPKEGRNVVCIAITHVGDFAITSPAWRGAVNKSEVKVSDEDEEIYSGMGIDKVKYDSESDECIKLDPGNYEGEILDIAILPGRSLQMGDYLTTEEQFALRSEIGELMRIARNSRPDDVYGVTVAAPTLGGR